LYNSCEKHRILQVLTDNNISQETINNNLRFPFLILFQGNHAERTGVDRRALAAAVDLLLVPRFIHVRKAWLTLGKFLRDETIFTAELDYKES